MATEQQELRTGGFAPLRCYAVLGDMRRAALVVADGAIDWLALPAMDAPRLCAALLDPAAGGSIDLTPTVPFDVSRRYVDDTLVLQTTFRTSEGTVRVTDALNRGAAGELPWAELARGIDVDDGPVPMRWSVRPDHGLAGLRPWCHPQAGQIRILVGERELAVITDGLGEPVLDARGVEDTVIAQAGRPALIAVVAAQNEPVHVPTAGEISARSDATAGSWRPWSDQISYQGRWTAAVVRSALTLKALTAAPSGAIAAAATTSLPEQVGDRDAPDLRVFYALDGSAVTAEMRAADAPGYQGSQPVHIGNSAAGQMRLSCFGDLLDAVVRYTGAGGLPRCRRLRPGRDAGRPGLRAVALAGRRAMGTRRPQALHHLQDRLLGGAGPGRAPRRGRPARQPARRPVARRARRDEVLDRCPLLVTGQTVLHLPRRHR